MLYGQWRAMDWTSPFAVISSMYRRMAGRVVGSYRVGVLHRTQPVPVRTAVIGGCLFIPLLSI